MDIDAVKAEISDMLAHMENQPENLRELHLQVMEKLNEIKAYGMPLPGDLVELEKKLQVWFEENKHEGHW